MEVVLVLVSPAVNIVRLDVNLEWPIRVLFFIAKLIELSKFHHGHSSSVVSDLGQVLANGLSGAVIVHFFKNVRPSVLEEVERLLTVEMEHSYPVGRVHTISEELDAVAWVGLLHLWGCLCCVRYAHDTVLSSTEDTSIW